MLVFYAHVCMAVLEKVTLAGHEYGVQAGELVSPAGFEYPDCREKPLNEIVTDQLYTYLVLTLPEELE